MSINLCYSSYVNAADHFEFMYHDMKHFVFCKDKQYRMISNIIITFVISISTISNVCGPVGQQYLYVNKIII